MSKKILVIAPSWIGDLIMSHSLYQLLKLNPENQIDLYAPKWSLPIVKRMPEISHAFELPFRHGELNLKARYRLGKSLRNKNYDQVIVLPGSLKSALVPLFSKIPKRTGFVGEQRYFLLNDIRKQRHALLAQRYTSLGRSKQEAQVNNDYYPPRLVVDKTAAAALMVKHRLTNDKPVAIFCPGAEFGPAKRWPHYHYSELACRLLNNNWQVWLMGSPKDEEVCQLIAEAINVDNTTSLFNLAGKTSLLDAIDLMSYGDVCISNDSGLMHLAASINLPLVALFGPTNPHDNPPLSKNSVIIDLGFKREKIRRGPEEFGYHPSLSKISPQQVYNAITKQAYLRRPTNEGA